MRSKAAQVCSELLFSAILLLLAGAYRFVKSIGGDSDDIRLLYEADRSDKESCLEQDECRFALGFALLSAAPLVICWNEHQYTRLTALYSAAKRFVLDLADPHETPSADLNGKFVCFSGRISGESTLQDEIFPFVKVENALLLVREIEIYQYVEVGSGDRVRLEERWCNVPKENPSDFPNKKNTVGNWAVFSNCDRMLSTGDTVFGENIRFGDNVAIFRAPSPSIGAFALPPSLLNEAFLGERHVHRLGELERVMISQGQWQDYDLRRIPNLSLPCNAVDTEGHPLRCFVSDSWVYDGDMSSIGTIRFKWRFVRPQSLTIAAEAVAPGRPCTDGYGLEGRKVDEPGALREMITKDWRSDFREELLSEETIMFESADESKWKVTPFSVFSKSWLPPFENKFLGRLWLYAPGNMSARRLFFKATVANACCALKVRFVAYVMLFAGWCLVFEPLTNLRVRQLRFLSPLLALAFGAAALVLATVCWTSCTALACISSHPFQSLLIMTATTIVLMLLLHKLDDDQLYDDDTAE